MSAQQQTPVKIQLHGDTADDAYYPLSPEIVARHNYSAVTIHKPDMADGYRIQCFSIDLLATTLYSSFEAAWSLALHEWSFVQTYQAHVVMHWLAKGNDVELASTEGEVIATVHSSKCTDAERKLGYMSRYGASAIFQFLRTRAIDSLLALRDTLPN